jgi:hypothetical protein
MANLYAFGFEGGVAPSGVTITTGVMRPTVGRRTSDSVWKWGLVASSIAQEQAEVSLDLGSALSKVGGSFYFRADNISYTTPLVLVDFGAVTISLTSSTNIRVNDGTSDTDYPVTDVTNGWNLLQFNIDLDATTDAISTNFNLEGIQSITLGSPVGGTDTILTIRGNKGYNSTLEDIRIETEVANGACPTSIECRKSSIQGAFKNQWTINGTPTGSSSGLNIRGVCYCHSTNKFYAIDSVGGIYKLDPETLTPTLITTVNSAYGHCAMVYHQALNRVYFVGNGNVAYLDVVGETVTYSAQTVYYAYNTNASGAYYEPATGNAYIVTQKNTTSTSSVAIHKIDVSGAYTSYVSTGVYTPAAPMTRHFNVCYDKTQDEILFPMFSSKVVGRCTQALSFAVSNPDGATTLTDINDAGGYWGGSGVFLVASDDATSRVRTYSTGIVARYETSVVTNAGITGKGLVYHPSLGVLLYQITGAVGDLYQCVKGNANFVKVATGALPANASVYLFGINPITGGLLYVYNNALSECHLLTDLSVSSLQIKDDKYIQSASNNNEMNLLPSSVINNDTAMIKMNACLKNAFGQGSVSLSGATKTVAGGRADYCGSADALPAPEFLYDFRDITTTAISGFANMGSGGGNISPAIGFISQSSSGDISSGRGALANTGSNTGAMPISSVGTGDFTWCFEVFLTSGTGYNNNTNYAYHLAGGSYPITISPKADGHYLYIAASLVYTAPAAVGTTTSFKICRSSGVLYLYMNGVLEYSQSLAGSLEFTGMSGGNNGGSWLIRCMAFWMSYISDPNPIAGLNRREIVVTKTA